MAIPEGEDTNGQKLFIGRSQFKNEMHCGKKRLDWKHLSCPYGNKEKD